MRWIKADKSVIICAPTSSGKTVLSSIVALIGKHDSKLDGKDEQKGKKVAELNKRGQDDDEISGDDSDDEGDNEEWEGDEEDDDNDDDDDEMEELKQMNLNKNTSNTDNQNQKNTNTSGFVDVGVSAAVGIDYALQDRITRSGFREAFSQGAQRVLFVVPSEPLVWQVAAFFSQLLRDEGDVTTKVALVTDQITFNPLKKFDVMPQIVVGTPKALESSLTKVYIAHLITPQFITHHFSIVTVVSCYLFLKKTFLCDSKIYFILIIVLIFPFFTLFTFFRFGLRYFFFF